MDSKVNIKLKELNKKDASKNRYNNIVSPPKTSKDLKKKVSFSKNADVSLITKISDKALKRKKVLSKLAAVNSKTKLPAVKKNSNTVNVEQDELTQKFRNNNAMRFEEIKNRIQDVSYLFSCLNSFYWWIPL